MNSRKYPSGKSAAQEWRETKASVRAAGEEFWPSIRSATSICFGYPKGEPFSSRRLPEYVNTRNVAYYVLYNFTGLNQSEGGRVIGRDHFAIFYALEKTPEFIKKEKVFQKRFIGTLVKLATGKSNFDPAVLETVDIDTLFAFIANNKPFQNPNIFTATTEAARAQEPLSNVMAALETIGLTFEGMRAYQAANPIKEADIDEQKSKSGYEDLSQLAVRAVGHVYRIPEQENILQGPFAEFRELFATYLAVNICKIPVDALPFTKLGYGKSIRRIEKDIATYIRLVKSDLKLPDGLYSALGFLKQNGQSIPASLPGFNGAGDVNKPEQDDAGAVLKPDNPPAGSLSDIQKIDIVIETVGAIFGVSGGEVCGDVPKAHDMAVYMAHCAAGVPLEVIAVSRLKGDGTLEDLQEQVEGVPVRAKKNANLGARKVEIESRLNKLFR